MWLYATWAFVIVTFIGTVAGSDCDCTSSQICIKRTDLEAKCVDLGEVKNKIIREPSCPTNQTCEHHCVPRYFDYVCVCENGYQLANDNASCTEKDQEESWRIEHTVLIVIAIFLIMIIFIACCLCARCKNLKENICCKSFISWACCMTGCFCKCNKGQADESTELYYHQVKINVSPNAERKANA